MGVKKKRNQDIKEALEELIADFQQLRRSEIFELICIIYGKYDKKRKRRT
jgi:hypothetical protein